METLNLIKIGQLALEIFKFESVDNGRRRRMDGGPLVYYKLTLLAFDSGELTKKKPVGKKYSSFNDIKPSRQVTTFYCICIIHVYFRKNIFMVLHVC